MPLSSSHAGAGEHLFLSPDLSDLSICVSDGDASPWRFPAHSTVLASQSVVFQTMLEDEFLEKTTRSIVIKDIKPKVVESLLGYIYKGKVSFENWLEGVELLRAAHKYQIEPLVQHCARFLETVITITNVCYIYKEAYLFTLTPLKEKCLKLILDAGFLLLRTKSFEMLSKEAVMEIVTSSALNIDSEVMVFEALLRWAPMRCCEMGVPVTEANVLQELEPFLKFMCFDDMSDSEKSALPASVLSCVQPNNRNRVVHFVPESLLQYGHTFLFRADTELLEPIAPSISLMAFSVDSPAYVLGITFNLVLNEFPCAFPLALTKEGCGNYSVISFANLASATFTEGAKVGGMSCYEAALLLKMPCPLEPRVVYELSMVDRSQINQCVPQTRLTNETVLTERGSVSISVHSSTVYGVTQIIVL